MQTHHFKKHLLNAIINNMQIKIFNTLSRKKEIFKPLHKSRVGLYTCGPTVYNYAHIGNLRTYLFEDILRKTLQYTGYRVEHVMNITDIDDKTIAASLAKHMTLKKLTRTYEALFKNNLKQLNILFPTTFARATDYIAPMIADVRKLIKTGFAYTSDGSVYFDVSKFKYYGKLARINKKELRSGVRVETDEYTKDEAQDFVLWKARKDNEPFWQSPLGPGRPGWHIECSAMSVRLLGQPFDIHAAGVDLIFPHHENEIAQAEAANEKALARYWIHGEHLMIDGQKMSKSLGNIFTLRDIEEHKAKPLALRYFFLGAHYRTQLNFTWSALTAAETALESLYDFVRTLKSARRNPRAGTKTLTILQKDFDDAIADDLNTPRALAALWGFVRAYNTNPDMFDPQATLMIFYKCDTILGLGLKKVTVPRIPADIRQLAYRREKARKAKDFAASDALRAQIQSLGWHIEDTALGPKITARDMHTF